MSRKGKLNWTKSEDDILISSFNDGLSLLQLATHLNRSVPGIENRLYGLGINRNKTMYLNPGDTFNRLTFISYTEKKNRSRYGKFSCICGEIIITKIAAIASGRTISCGCYAPEKYKELHGKPEGHALKKELYTTYIRNAKYRNYEFNITEYKFYELILLNCFLCGIEPQQPGRKYRRQNAGNFRYNGVDRWDNTKGYTDDNVKTCCGRCNAAKSDMSIEEFTDWLKRIVEKNNGN